MSSFISRFGAYAQKVGMSRIFVEKKAVAITLLKVPTSYLIEKKETEEFSVLKLGVQTGKKLKNINKPRTVELQKLNKPVCDLIKEFKVSKEEADAITESFKMDWLEEGVFLDVQSKSIGKGFAGVMKRWHFKGGPASHGSSLFHRGRGSIGTRDKLFKKVKMAGRLGQNLTTIQSQKILYKDEELGLIGIAGTVPGKTGVWVKLSKAIKKAGV